MEKLFKQKGEARIVVIFLIIAIALAFVALIPLGRNIYEMRMESLDEDYIDTAERMAKKDFLDNPEAFTRVFDSQNKRFLELKDIESVPSYSNAAIHEGMYLVVKADNDGNITIEWMTKEKIKKLAKGV